MMEKTDGNWIFFLTKSIFNYIYSSFSWCKLAFRLSFRSFVSVSDVAVLLSCTRFPVCSVKLMLSDRSPCHRTLVAQSPAILMTHSTLIGPRTTLRVWVLLPGPAVDVTCPPLP